MQTKMVLLWHHTRTIWITYKSMCGSLSYVLPNSTCISFVCLFHMLLSSRVTKTQSVIQSGKSRMCLHTWHADERLFSVLLTAVWTHEPTRNTTAGDNIASAWQYISPYSTTSISVGSGCFSTAAAFRVRVQMELEGFTFLGELFSKTS